MAPPTWRWTYESTKYSIEQEQQQKKKKTRKKVQFYRYLGKAQESIWFIIFIIWKEKNSALWVQTRSFGRCGMGDTLLPLLTRKRRLQAWQKLWYLFGGDGVRSTARDQLSRRQPESWGDEGWGPLKKVLRHLQCASFFATDRGELRPSELSTYSTAQHSTVDGWMPCTGQAHSPINSVLILTLDATPPASGATPMIICMRGLMTVIRAAYYEATPLELISREKKKHTQPHLAREGVLTTIFYFIFGALIFFFF